MVVGHDGRLADHGGVLEITVCDGSAGISVGHQCGLHFRWEWVAPKVRGAVRVVVNAAHAGLGGVGGTHEGWQFGYDLSQVGGTAAQACGQGGKGVEVLAQGCCDVDAVCSLRSLEQAGGC